MQIREGAYYITNCGETVGPATPNPRSIYFHWNIPLNGDFRAYRDDGTFFLGNRNWDIAAEAPALWRDMTPEQKGALLLAHHEGRVIEWTNTKGIFENSTAKGYTPVWSDSVAYRVRQEAKRETVTLYAQQPNNAWDWVPSFSVEKTHRITFDLLDGEPDCASIKMEKL